MKHVLVTELKTAQDLVLDPSKEIVIYGCGGIGRDVYFSLHQYTNRIRAFCDRNDAFAGSYLYGLPIVKPEQLPRNKNLLILVSVWETQARDSIVDEICRQDIDCDIIDFKSFNFNRLLMRARHAQIECPNFTFISNTELGDNFSECVGLPEHSFTAGLMLNKPDFLKLCDNLPSIIDNPLEFVPKSDCIAGLTNGIEIMFTRARTIDDAKRIWCQKTEFARYHPRRLAIVDDGYFLFSETEMLSFTRSSIESAAIITNQLLLDPSIHYVWSDAPEGSTSAKKVNAIYREFYIQDRISLGKLEFATPERDYFNIVKWINSGEVSLVRYPERLIENHHD